MWLSVFFSHYTNNKSFTQFAFEHGKVEVELESHYIHVGPRAYNCSNYKNPEHSCHFNIWRNISGHVVTPEEVKQICEKGQTDNVLELFKDDGTVYYKRLGLNKEHNQIIKI